MEKFVFMASGLSPFLPASVGYPKIKRFWENTMKHLIMSMMLGVSLLITSTGLALARDVHTVTGTKGQPNQTIGTTQTGTVTPGHASTAPGSAFNPNGNAGTHYAGTQTQNSKNAKSVAQYDVAGFQQSHK